MPIPRRFTIAESSHRILDPIAPDALRSLGRSLGWSADTTVLDLACGKGEALCQWSAEHGLSGLGIDLNPPFVAAARERAVELGVQRRVQFLERDASDFVAEHAVDVVSCCGATWIGGGVLGTLDLLARSLRTGGVALVGDCYWREVPTTDEAVRGSLAHSVDDYPTLWGLIEQVQAAGWDVVEMVHADEDSWDRYVAAQWLNLRRFVDVNPDDAIVPELRAELDTEPARYARYQRRYLGWGILALMRR